MGQAELLSKVTGATGDQSWNAPPCSGRSTSIDLLALGRSGGGPLMDPEPVAAMI